MTTEHDTYWRFELMDQHDDMHRPWHAYLMCLTCRRQFNTGTLVSRWESMKQARKMHTDYMEGQG